MSTQIPPKTAEDAPGPDVWAAAEEATDGFFTALKEAINRLPDPTDLDEPTETLRAALDRIRPDAAEPALRAAAVALRIPGVQ